VQHLRALEAALLALHPMGAVPIQWWAAAMIELFLLLGLLNATRVIIHCVELLLLLTQALARLQHMLLLLLLGKATTLSICWFRDGHPNHAVLLRPFTEQLSCSKDKPQETRWHSCKATKYAWCSSAACHFIVCLLQVQLLLQMLAHLHH
jgi:hypothetical protein